MEKGRLLAAAGIVLVTAIAFFCWCYAKKSEKVSKWGWRVIGVLAAAFAVFTVWYHIPMVCRDDVMLLEIETQEEITVELELVIRRSYFHAPEMSGWIATPTDVYRASWIGGLYRQEDAYNCNTLFRSDPGYMGGIASFDNTVMIFGIDFTWDFSEVKRLRLQEWRQEGEWHQYDTVRWY